MRLSRNPINKALRELEPFKSGINYLGPGHKIETLLCSGAQADRVPEKSLNAIASYKDSTGNEDNKTFTFEFGNWENTSQSNLSLHKSMILRIGLVESPES